MKGFLQIVLFSILVSISFFFYKSYFFEKKEVNDFKVQKPIEQSVLTDQKNVITNLKYNIELANNGSYEIKSGSSELIYENGSEIIFMEDVQAIFTNNNNEKILITSDNASFNSKTYNTYFRENIKIQYENHVITSNKIDFNFTDNRILVYDKVVYTSFNKKIQTDNIEINLITKQIKFYMNNPEKNIKIISK